MNTKLTEQDIEYVSMVCEHMQREGYMLVSLQSEAIATDLKAFDPQGTNGLTVQDLTECVRVWRIRRAMALMAKYPMTEAELKRRTRRRIFWRIVWVLVLAGGLVLAIGLAG